MNQDFYFERFIESHSAKYNDAFEEITAGKKTTHWTWFIFPIISGLSKSNISQYYAIDSVSEACAFLEHKILGFNYIKCVEAMMKHHDKPIDEILGKDKWKFKSSLTLFLYATKNPELKNLISKCF